MALLGVGDLFDDLVGGAGLLLAPVTGGASVALAAGAIAAKEASEEISDASSSSGSVSGGLTAEENAYFAERLTEFASPEQIVQEILASRPVSEEDPEAEYLHIDAYAPIAGPQSAYLRQMFATSEASKIHPTGSVSTLFAPAARSAGAARSTKVIAVVGGVGALALAWKFGLFARFLGRR